MVAVLAFVAVVRLRLLDFPLERDEGEYAYAGQLMLQGIPPYELAYNMKFPGTYAAYALIMAVFGQTTAGIHLGIFCLTTATALLLFWLGKKILDETAGVVAATGYAVLAASPSMLGLAGHATHFCAFFVAAGFGLLWRARQTENILTLAAAGFVFGVAVLMKQQAVIIAAWAGLAYAAEILFFNRKPLRLRFGTVAVFGAAMLLPLCLCCLWLWHAGVLAKFKFWTIDYAQQYEKLASVGDGWVRFKLAYPGAVATTFSIWLLAFLGAGLLFCDVRLRGSRRWLLGFGAASALATVPGFYFRPHYFLVMLPAVALFAGVAVSVATQFVQRLDNRPRFHSPALFYILFLTVTIWGNREIWLLATPTGAARAAYGLDPLPEAQATAEFVAAHCPAGATIAILGSDPEIFFLSRHRSATGYIYAYALTEKQAFAGKMQREFVGEISGRSPDIIICAGDFQRWMDGAGATSPVPAWWAEYRKNFALVQTIKPPPFVGPQSMGGSFGFEIFQRKPAS